MKRMAYSLFLFLEGRGRGRGRRMNTTRNLHPANFLFAVSSKKCQYSFLHAYSSSIRLILGKEGEKKRKSVNSTWNIYVKKVESEQQDKFWWFFWMSSWCDGMKRFRVMGVKVVKDRWLDKCQFVRDFFYYKLKFPHSVKNLNFNL